MNTLAHTISKSGCNEKDTVQVVIFTSASYLLFCLSGINNI